MKKLNMSEANWNALRPVLIWTLLILVPCGVFAWFDKPILNWLLEHNWAKYTTLWILFALFCGWGEAILIHTLVKLGYDIPGAIHSIFNVLRFFVWLPMAQLAGWYTAGCWIGLFIFFHDWKYYTHRNKLNPSIYLKKGWSDPSPTSKALLDKILFNWVRIVCLIASTVGLIYFNRTELW